MKRQDIIGAIPGFYVEPITGRHHDDHDSDL